MNGRIQARAAASLLGVTARTVQNLANRGELPGAAKIGKVWTFDPQKLTRLLTKHGGALPPDYGKPEPEITPIKPAVKLGDFVPKVYVVGYGAYIKIGFSEAQDDCRLRSLQTGCPEPLTVHIVFYGSRKLESALHGKFKAHRLNGEWFRRRGSLARWIDAGFPLAERDGKLVTTERKARA
jgi:Meiotically up-regulated gene 113/Helix-turn-helix domain